MFFDFHNTIDRYFVPGQRRPFAIPWPNKKPELIPEIVNVVKTVLEAATEDTENLTCVSVLSHINDSPANENWLRDTIYNTVEEVGEVTTTGRVLFDIIVVTRQRDGRHGKLQIAKKIPSERRAADPGRQPRRGHGVYSWRASTSGCPRERPARWVAATPTFSKQSRPSLIGSVALYENPARAIPLVPLGCFAPTP